MNKTKLGFVTLLTRVGLEEKASEALVTEMKKQLPTLKEMSKNTAKLKEVQAQYQELSNQMIADKAQLEEEIVELRQSINKLNIASNIVAQVMEINKQIADKEEMIKALAGAQMALGQKSKADQLDILAECYTASRKINSECSELIATTQPMVNGLNKETIKKAVSAIGSEVTNQNIFYNNVTKGLNLAEIHPRHNGVSIYLPNDNPFIYSNIK